jgi:predicted dinucleotide-binding enzyme
VDLGGKYSSELIKKFVPGARLVKAFNHLGVEVLAQPEVAGGKRVLFYSGDDAAAKAEVRKIIEATGFFPVDLGSLDVGGPLASLPFGALSSHNFVRV